MCTFCLVPFPFSLCLSISHLLHLSLFNHCPVVKGNACVVGTWKGEFTAGKITYSTVFLRDRSSSMKNILQIFKIFITFLCHGFITNFKIIKTQNGYIKRNFKDHLVTALHHWQRLLQFDQIALDPFLHGLELFQRFAG